MITDLANKLLLDKTGKTKEKVLHQLNAIKTKLDQDFKAGVLIKLAKKHEAARSATNMAINIVEQLGDHK